MKIEKLEKFLSQLGIDVYGYTIPYIESTYLDRLRHKEIIYPRANTTINHYYNPFLIMEDASLVISIGLSYHQPYNKNNHQSFGYTSKTSYGIDYHHQIYEYLKQIVIFLEQEQPDLKSYLSCDTKEIDDRYYSYICGNGFYGKNTMIINETFGSEVFYGTLITNLKCDVKKAKLIKNGCYDCCLCQEACPTNALNNYQLDYTKCISHLSQTKQLIAYDLLKHRLYGCDTCNNVCFYNKNVEVNQHFKEDKGFYDLIQIITSSQSEFKELFKQRSLLWLNQNIIKKNAILNLEPYLNDKINEVIKI
ncbi:MAG: epoxyqueuosine reductase, partial [Bacilli bacterium]